MAKKINITAQLNAATTDGILADAGQIFDAKKGKFQEQVNEEFENALEETITSEDTGMVVESIEEGIVHNALRKNKQILSEAEKYQARHNISAITAEEAEKIAQDKINETSVSSPDKLQAVKELSSWLESNPENAATMNADIQENAADIQRLYRGTGIDEYSQFSTGMDYAAGDVVLYDGVLFRFKADHAKGDWDYNEVEEWSEKKEREAKLTELEPDVIFDISKYNKADNELKTYTDLSDALTDVPVDRRHGGITVRYVQTSDNKYVQFQCKAQSFSTNPADWVGVTDAVENVSEISKEKVLTEGETIQITNDAGTEVIHEITEDYANFKNLKNNGKDVLDTDDLKDITDEVNGIKTNLTPASSWEKLPLFLANDDKYSTGSNSQSIAIPCKSGDKYFVKGAGNNCVIAFVKTYPEAGENADYATGSQRTLITGTNKVEGIVPLDANYLYVSYAINGASWFAEKIIINGYDYVLGLFETLNPRVFTVNKAGGADFTSLTECIAEATKYDGATVYVENGEYDIIAEYKELYGSDFFDNFTSPTSNYGIVLKNRINVIFSAGAKVVCHYAGSNAYVREKFSPFNSGGIGFVIDGLNIDTSNVRYCIHDELGNSTAPYINVYRNCIMHSDNSESDQTFRACIGGGLGKNGTISISSCVFSSEGLTAPRGIVTYHNTVLADAQSYVVITNNVFKGYGSTYAHYYGESTKMSQFIISNNKFDEGYVLPVAPEAGATIVNVQVEEYNNTGNHYDIYPTKQEVNEITSELQEDIDALESKTSSISNASVIENTQQVIMLCDDNEKEITTIEGKCLPNVNDEILFVDSDYSEESPDDSKVALSIKKERTKANTFVANNFKTEDGVTIVKENYFKQAQFIPDLTSPNLGGTVFYNGDTKVNSNYIVNAVAYPNGEIIACRQGGAVVKIAKDGTETILMTISGAGDWRGVFMDKDLNVYVSPHASFGGSGMAMTDRGLYRLAYGQSTFEKVISLYDPNSDVPSEAVQNDDTIWTMCQDRKGYLYAGVYSHTTRFNPAIYRSTDNGVTWTYLYNFITSGVCISGHHIHTIIYNEYDNKLYCIVGEVNEIYCSSDNGVTWEGLEVHLEDGKGSAMIAVKDGLIVGSDTAYSCLMSKVYTNKDHKTTGRMWSNTVFAIRRSDLTGWLYAFTKIDSSVNVESYMPPIEAINDAEVLQDWIDGNPAFLAGWQKMYNDTKDYYPDDCIRPQHCAILCSKDEGETWEIVYKKFTTSTKAYGFPTTGYFRNGECLTGSTVDIDGSLKFTNPVIISEGSHKYTADGLDISGSIFAKTLLNTIINN